MNAVFESIQQRDEWIIANSDYFTVGRRLGPAQGYERHEVKTLDEAKSLAGRMANEAGKTYLVYAVAGTHDCFVCAKHPDSNPSKG